MNAIKPWTLLRLPVYVWASSIGHGKERLRDCTNSRHSAILLKGIHRKTWWLKKEKKNTDICDLTCRFFLWIEEKARTPNVIAEKMKTAMITAKTFWDLFNMERRYLRTEASWRSISESNHDNKAVAMTQTTHSTRTIFTAFSFVFHV